MRERYSKAVAAYRERTRRAKSALIVVIDADKGGVQRRSRQLADALDDPRGDQEAIVHLIPRRTIETWILCLNGQAVDEETDYANRADIEVRITEAAEVFFMWCRPNATAPDHCVPSLNYAIHEIRRLD